MKNPDPLEKVIEAAVCKYAQSKGFLTYKFTSPARVACPDRLMIAPTGRVSFIEFKRKGQKPTPAQQREHDRLEKQNVNVFVVDDIDFGKGVIDGLSGNINWNDYDNP